MTASAPVEGALAMSGPIAPSSPDPFRLASDDVHCWRVGLDAPVRTHARLYATLAADERRRGARFRFQRDRRRFVIAHGALRDLLGRYLGILPHRIRYAYNAFGKPALDPGLGGRLAFNLSHSAGLALIAIAARSNVGIDVERIRPQADHAELARCFLSTAEAARLRAVPERLRDETFLGCWTKQEAWLKAMGHGLAGLPAGPDDVAHAVRWSVRTLRPAPGYIGALVIEGRGWRLREWGWSPDPRRDVRGAWSME